MECKTGNDTVKFFNAAFAGKGETDFILLWRKSDKTSSWASSVEEASVIAEENRDQDFYVGFSLSPQDFGSKSRCKAENTAGIVALVIDFDIQGDAHTKKNLPPDVASVLSMLPADLPPSMVVHSGHGLQAWWMLKEPWMFADNKERSDAALLTQRFNYWFKQRAGKHGWDVDSTFDLARVYRVPGTTNCKIAGEERPVRILSSSDKRYNPSDIAEYLDDVNALAPTLPVKTTVGLSTVAFVLNEAANPPFDKFDALRQIEPRFADSWDHVRLDLQDQSPSAFDMSLATHAAMSNWTDQEIADLLIAHRRRHKSDLKLDRIDYYQRTIGRARAQAAEYWKDMAAESILAGLSGTAVTLESPLLSAVACGSEDAAGICVATSATPEATVPNRSVLLAALSRKLGVEITCITKFDGDSGQYRIQTTRGAAQLGTIDNLITESKLRSALADATGRYMPNIGPKAWPPIAQALLEACEIVERGVDATLAGTLTEYLCAYIGERPPQANIEDAYDGREPFVANGKIHLFIDTFMMWLQTRRNERISRNDLTANLSTIGCSARTFHVDVNGKRTTRSAWELPEGPWADAVS